MKRFTMTVLSVICLFVGSGFIICRGDNDNNKTTIETKADTVLNERNVYIAILMNDIKYPEVVMSQIMIESANLTSNLCKRGNNLLGMTVASKRQTMAVNKSGYAKYKSWFDCIIDYKLYQDYILSRHNLDTRKKYITFLHRNYAKSKTYFNSITNLSRNYELLRSTYYLGGI